MTTIFKFDLPFHFGPCYCSVDDFRDRSEFYGVLVRVYDFFEENYDPDPRFFMEIPYFMNTLPLLQMPSMKGKYKWTKLGTVVQKVVKIPFFKNPTKEGFAFDSLNAYESIDWFYESNLNTQLGPVPHLAVRHLEELFARSTLTLEKRVVMQKLRYERRDVVQFFSEHLSTNSWMTDFKTQQFVPLYKLIPKEIREVPLVKGLVPDHFLELDWEKFMSPSVP